MSPVAADWRIQEMKNITINYSNKIECSIRARWLSGEPCLQASEFRFGGIGALFLRFRALLRRESPGGVLEPS